MDATSIHLRPVEVSNKQEVLYLHATLSAEQSRRGTGVETVSGDDLQCAGRNNIRSRCMMNHLVHVLLQLHRPSSVTPHARTIAVKVPLLKLTCTRWKQCLPHASS